MNTLKRITAVFLTAALCLFTVSCEKEPVDPVEPQLVPSEAAVAGVWELTGHSLAVRGSTPFMYIVLERSEMTFTMYSNVNSGATQVRTGTFSLSGKNGEYTITGIYDHGGGFWNNDYLITGLTAREMEWTVSDNPEDVSVFTRVDAVPEEILNEVTGE